VIEEQRTVEVPLRREEVHVERVPVTEQTADVGAETFTKQDIEVPVVQEEVVIEKRPRVTEEVRIHKDTVTEHQQVSDTVRKERVIVEGANEMAREDTTVGTD